MTVCRENGFWFASLFVKKRAQGDMWPEYVVCTALGFPTHINTLIMTQSSLLADNIFFSDWKTTMFCPWVIVGLSLLPIDIFYIVNKLYKWNMLDIYSKKDLFYVQVQITQLQAMSPRRVVTLKLSFSLDV